jgi:hypothetical protein
MEPTSCTEKQGWSLVSQLASHLLMGTLLGLIFTLSLVATNLAGVFDLIKGTSQPMQSLLVLAVSFASTFGVGATITGFLFEEIERHS